MSGWLVTLLWTLAGLVGLVLVAIIAAAWAGIYFIAQIAGDDPADREAMGEWPHVPRLDDNQSAVHGDVPELPPNWPGRRRPF